MATEKRLIYANELSEKIGNMKSEITRNRGGYLYCNEDEKNEWNKLDGFDSLVCDAPTVDAVEMVHGHWVSDKADILFHCSVCETQISTDWDYDDLSWNYCPNCGAKMDE